MKVTNYRKSSQWAITFAIAAIIMSMASCSTPKTEKKQYSETTQELIDMVEGDSVLKALLTKAIAKAKEINPDTVTNPAQTLEEYYDFVEWSMKAMPWSVVKTKGGTALYDRIDQSLDYCYFINDIPLEELEGKGLYNNAIQYIEPYREWLKSYAKAWGKHLSTPQSWNDEYLKEVMSDETFGLTKGWYESPDNWHSFNEFFARYLSSPDARPIAEPDNDSVIASPADSKPQGVWAIDDSSQIVQKDGVLIKSRKFNCVNELLGPNSKYKDAFAGGTLTHSFLDVNDYHRYHFPVSGKIMEMEVISADDAAGGITLWDPEQQRYVLHCDVPGWQSIETRGLVIVETENNGLVALLPIGMSQVSSVNFEDNLKVGDTVKKGDMLGYFLFGGSDFVLLFQKGYEYTPSTETFTHILMGEELGRLTKK